MSKDKILYINPKTERPNYYSVAEHLWGKAINIDSDGNSVTPDDKNWTELTLINRNNIEERIDIDPIQLKPLILKIMGTANLVEKSANFLSKYCNCQVKKSLNEFIT